MSKERGKICTVKTLLNKYLTHGIIKFDEVVGLEKEAIINKILKKVHPYAISQTTNGQWITYVVDPQKKNGRRQIRKKAEHNWKFSCWIFMLFQQVAFRR